MHHILSPYNMFGMKLIKKNMKVQNVMIVYMYTFQKSITTCLMYICCIMLLCMCLASSWKFKTIWKSGILIILLDFYCISIDYTL
jgi:hypothetical protein